jgi:hypothetical protein
LEKDKSTGAMVRAVPPLLPRQLAFPFILDAHEVESGLGTGTPWQRAGMGRSAFYARRRVQRAVSIAIELERRRRKPAAPVPARISWPFEPNHGEAAELLAIARRIEWLCISHRWPERFHEDKSEIVFALRAIAARANRGPCMRRRG